MFKISERHWAWLGRLAIIVTLLGAPTIFLTLCHRSPTASLIAKVQDFCSAAVPSVEISGYPAHLLLNVLELEAPLSLFAVALHTMLFDIVFQSPTIAVTKSPPACGTAPAVALDRDRLFHDLAGTLRCRICAWCRGPQGVGGQKTDRAIGVR